MKRVLLRFYLATFLCIYCLVPILSQPRTEGGTSAQVVKTSPVITNFVGWYYNSEHQKWCGSYNVIGGGTYKNSKTPRRLTAGDLAVYDDNIISMQFKKVKFDGEYYYLLLAPYWKGKYRYPTIEVDWYWKKVTNVYVFTEGEYNKLKNLQEGITKLSTIYSTSYGGGIGFGLCETFNSAMMYLFKSRQDLHSSHHTYHFYVKKEDTRTIRFQNLSSLELDESTDKPHYPQENFNFSYYEISANIFKQIIIQ